MRRETLHYKDILVNTVGQYLHYKHKDVTCLDRDTHLDIVSYQPHQLQQYKLHRAII